MRGDAGGGARPGPTARTCDVGGIPMRWEESGAGTPVVLVHGIPTSPRLWRHVVPRLKRVRALAWEMVGYGDSIPAGRGRDLSVAMQAEYLVRWLDALGLERVVLVGHDLGGGVAQIAAVRHPARCAGLVLTNAVAYDSWPIPSLKLLRAAGGLVRRLPGPAVKTGVFRMLMARGHDDARVAAESLDVHWARYAAHGPGTRSSARRARSTRGTRSPSPTRCPGCITSPRAWSGAPPTRSRR